jgi:hypothetical protein
MTELAAQPKYPRGEMVVYTDHHGRQQTGKVLHIEAHWSPWSSAGHPPLILYAISHPTYRNRRANVGEDKIHYADPLA